MNSRSSFLALAGGLCAIPLLLSMPAAAQQDDDLGTLVNNALAAMKAEKWEEALAASNDAVARYGKNQPLKLFGPKFGTIYYRKGICELKLKKWNEALESFETCYRDFPNPAGGRENPFQKMALLKWGEAAMGAQNWELAISQFQKFIAERDNDAYPQGVFHTSMAVCNYKLGRVPEGNEHLEIAIKNKESFPTPDTAIIAGFQELVTGVILKRNEQALLDFVAKNRGELVIEPYLMHQYSRVFMKLAADAIGADMERAAMALYQFIPSTDVAIDDLRARLKALGPLQRITDGTNTMLRKKLQEDLASLETESRGKQSTEMVKLAAAAFLHEKNGNVRGAYAAYLQLESFYQSSEKREDNLYNLIRTSSSMGTAAETQKHAETFVKRFPDSRHIPAVRRLMLSVLFYDGKYDTCIEIAAPMLETLKPGSQEHDICMHTLSGSYFYTGQHEKAQPLLDEHVEKYPKSLFALSSAYFRAANLSRLQNWSKAAPLLDAFLKTYPDPAKNVFLPFAIYDRASCHFYEEQPEAALEKIALLVKDFPNSNVIDQAYMLRGNIEQSLENADRAEQAFILALQSAEKLRHPGLAGEALYSLISLLGQPESARLKDAIPYADQYWKDYAEGSPFRTRVAVAQFAALSAVGRAEDGLARLRDVITELASHPESVGLEPLINSYTEFYLTKHTPDELKEHYYNFPGIRSTDSAARALLRVAVIGVFEGVIKKTPEEDKKRAGTAMIKVLFQELKTDFALKDLTNFILVKIGDYLRTNTATPREALPYYDEALSRKEAAQRFPALLGRADIYGNSTTAADIDKALEDFTKVYTDSQEVAERDFSLYRIVELLLAKKDFAKAAEQAQIYLDPKKSNITKPRYSPQVGLLLAKTFEERKMVDDAISMYVKVWSAHMGNIKISAPAMKNWMQLSWGRNKISPDPAVPSDRQGAYEGGARFIELTGRFKDKMIESDLLLWQEVGKLVQTYEANPNIKSMAEIKREKEEARKMKMRR
ncbi:MAG: tetratricopeptide repeat protein [Luteolibacter sp.]|jgi:tetratricopeptide (TPR) repeat protein|nr:tetratricopeptide repeat protein [Luteolibacter sp.]